MKAVVFHGIGDIRVDEVAEPRIEEATDAIVRLTRSAVCGTDLHLIRGTVPGVRPGTILGHEGVGVVERVGRDVRNLQPGDRVVIPSTIACGACSYCRAGYTAQCDVANPNGPRAGTAFFGGPRDSGPFQGLQAEKARVPFAHFGLVKLPDAVSDDQAILLSDIFPTGWTAAELAEIRSGDTVAVFGCGPVGLCAILAARLQGAGRIFAVDRVPSRLAKARELGAEVVDFEAEDPVGTLRRLTNGIGPDRAIDAVGVDAEHAHAGPAGRQARAQRERFDRELEEIAPVTRPDGETWVPGDAPSQVLRWAVEAVAKAGTVSIVGVYPTRMDAFPIGAAMNKNLTVKMGNCNHRAVLPKLVDLVASGVVDPTVILDRAAPLTSAIEAYRAFDRREAGWTKVELLPEAEPV